MYESNARRPRQPAPYNNHHFTTVSNVWPARSDERVARASSKFAFHHSFGRPMSTKRRKGCAGPFKICVSPQFWTSDEHEVTRGLLRRRANFAFHHSFGRPMSTKWREGCFADLKKLHVTTVLDVRRPRSDEKVARDMCKICISPQFWTSDDHEVTRGLRGTCAKSAFHHSFGRPTTTKWREGCLPSVSTKPTRRKKKKKFLKRSWSTAILSSHFQQLFSAILSSSSQHSHSQQPLSADLLSSHSQQIFSAANLSSHFQQPFSAATLSSSSQPFSADLLSSHSQQTFSAIILLWSGVGGQLFDHHLTVVSCFIMLLWSGVGGQLLSHHVAMVKGWWFAIWASCCYGQGLVVSFWSSCCYGQGLVVSYWSSWCYGQGLVVSYWSSCCYGQGLVVSYWHVL